MWDLFKTLYKSNYLSKTFDFKQSHHLYDLPYLHPNMYFIIGTLSKFCQENGIKLVFTSAIRTPRHNKMIGATSKTHEQGRGLDFSIRSKHGWTYDLIQEVVSLITKKHSDIGAISAKTGLSRPIYIHKNANNNGKHGHLQVRP